ncbi:MAG: PAS domain S-box protein [Desulfuromonadales bacterium]
MSNVHNSVNSGLVFKRRIALTVILLNLFVYSFAGYYLFQSKASYERRAVISTQNIANVLEQHLKGEIDKIDMALIAVKNEAEGQIARGGVNSEALNRYITHTHSYLPGLQGLRMTDAKGDIIYGTGLTSDVITNIVDRDYFIFERDKPKGDIFISKPLISRISKQWSVIIARRVNNPDGSFAGVVYGSLLIDHFIKIFSGVDVGKKGSLTLRDSELALIARYPEIKNTIGSKSVSKEFSDSFSTGNNNATFKGYAGIDATLRRISYRKLSDYPLVVVVAISEDEYLSGWRAEATIQITLIAIFTLVTIFTSRMLLTRWNHEKEIESELRDKRKQLSNIIEFLPDATLAIDMEKRVIIWNRAIEEMTGVSAAEVIGKGDHAYTIPFYGLARPSLVDMLSMDREDIAVLYPNITRTGDTLMGEVYCNSLYDNKGAWVIAKASPLYDQSGAIIGAIEVIRDITSSKQAEEQLTQYQQNLEKLVEERTKELQESKLLLEKTFESLNEAIFIVETGTRKILDCNVICEKMFGYSKKEFIGVTTTILHISEEMSKRFGREMLEAYAEKGYYETQFIMRRKDGTTFDSDHSVTPILDESGAVLRQVCVVRDISERKRAEAERENMQKQLLNAQKLESLGVLAGGIAHDFNNILTSIVGNVDLALMRINKESPVVSNLHAIEKASARAADLAKQMLAYSGKGKFVIENLDLGRLVEDMLHMLEVSISKNNVLRLNLAPNLPTVEADATQLRQIIMNLVINASEAIDNDEGVISVTTSSMECNRDYLMNFWQDQELNEGLYVCLEISDTGCGMNSETVKKIFDPFFTTKFTGRGLGMAAVYGIVRGHKGAINIYSEPGKGSTLKVLLPASGKSVENINNDGHRDDWKGAGKVLLVDDEETVRGIGFEMLKELGFTPITANDGREAVELFDKNHDFIFVILDLTMPRMDGEQCFRELKKIKPDVKVFMSSGFSENDVTQKFAGKGLAGFIQKPYKLSTLREIIKSI